jgi:hypothetical protein
MKDSTWEENKDNLEVNKKEEAEPAHRLAQRKGRKVKRVYCKTVLLKRHHGIESWLKCPKLNRIDIVFSQMSWNI